MRPRIPIAAARAWALAAGLLVTSLLAAGLLAACAPGVELAPAVASPDPVRAAAFLDWQALANPVYSRPGWSVKDPALIERDGVFYLFFSAFFPVEGQERCHVVGVRTADFRTYSEPLFVLDGADEGWTGACSPNVVQIEGRTYLVYNSWGDRRDQPNQLYYGWSDDLETWTFGLPLAADLTQGRRAIDAALAFQQGRYYLLWKEGQVPQVAWAESLDGEWRRLGRPSGGWFENGQWIEIDGATYLVATGHGHRPTLRRMAGEGALPEDWLQWGPAHRLEVPGEAFNTNLRADGAFLVDWRAYDGYFYLVYAGRTEGRSHDRRGDNRLGLARSRDLVDWVVPPGAELP